jgi:hypothetical protein
MDRSQETIEIFGATIPKWQDCTRCGAKFSCLFMTGVGYYQPCGDCRKKPEYRKELDEAIKKQKHRAKVDDSLKAQLPVAVHQYNGRYLYTNHRGDIIKDEKVRPMKTGEKYTK